MAERKCQVIGKSASRPVAFIEDGPRSIFPAAAAYMLPRHATRPPDRPAQGELLYKGRPASQLGAARDGLMLEHTDVRRWKPHPSKIVYLGRKEPQYRTLRRKPLYQSRSRSRNPFFHVEERPNSLSAVEIRKPWQGAPEGPRLPPAFRPLHRLHHVSGGASMPSKKMSRRGMWRTLQRAAADFSPPSATQGNCQYLARTKH